MPLGWEKSFVGMQRNVRIPEPNIAVPKHIRLCQNLFRFNAHQDSGPCARYHSGINLAFTIKSGIPATIPNKSAEFRALPANDKTPGG